ncbi:site-2 protease family protein [Candidatus Woesearchaeota archaeon]|nr:site-2 protease family protein [Candidatus Woesearchaeota archaeon]
MVAVDLLLAGVFYFVLYSLYFLFPSKFHVQSKFIILYRTKIGLRFMDKLAKSFPRVLKVLSYISISSGFLGMAFIFAYLFKGAYLLLVQPGAQPVLSPVLPGVATVPGAPILSFTHWIISLLVIVVVHEFCHGIYCRLHNVPVKSSGFVFLGPLLGAFVEPDDKKFEKQKTYPQLSVLSAGAFANFIFAGIFFFVLMFILNPIVSHAAIQEGVQITTIQSDLPISQSHLRPGMVLDSINNQTVSDPQIFVKILRQYHPNEIISITANNTTSLVRLASNPANSSLSYLGVGVTPASVHLTGIFERMPLLYSFFIWTYELFFWLFTISLGVGLFNLLPLGPIDGGKMFYVASLWMFKKEQKARQVWIFISLVCLILIGINLFPHLLRLLSFLFHPILALFS